MNENSADIKACSRTIQRFRSPGTLDLSSLVFGLALDQDLLDILGVFLPLLCIYYLGVLLQALKLVIRRQAVQCLLLGLLVELDVRMDDLFLFFVPVVIGLRSEPAAIFIFCLQILQFAAVEAEKLLRFAILVVGAGLEGLHQLLLQQGFPRFHLFLLALGLDVPLSDELHIDVGIVEEFPPASGHNRVLLAQAIDGALVLGQIAGQFLHQIIAAACFGPECLTDGVPHSVVDVLLADSVVLGGSVAAAQQMLLRVGGRCHRGQAVGGGAGDFRGFGGADAQSVHGLTIWIIIILFMLAKMEADRNKSEPRRKMGIFMLKR